MAQHLGALAGLEMIDAWIVQNNLSISGSLIILVKSLLECKVTDMWKLSFLTYPND